MERRMIVVSGAVVGGLAVAGLVLFRWWRHRKREENPYETEKSINEYMGFHYASPEEYVHYSYAPKDAFEFPSRCAEICHKNKSDVVVSRALDIGCAVGRSTFELAREFDEVVGIDYSAGFIRKCQELKDYGKSMYELTVEGDLCSSLEAVVDSDIDRERVVFRVGDACNLPKDIGQFGMVLAANLICRLPDPMAFFDRLKDLVVPAGLVVITSPYTWLTQYTPKSRWIGGYTKEDVPIRGFEALKQILSPHFMLVEEENIPFLIRETVRKHQWTVAHYTVWMRRID